MELSEERNERQRSERGTSRGKSLMKRRTNNAALGGRRPRGIFNTTGYEDKEPVTTPVDELSN